MIVSMPGVDVLVDRVAGEARGDEDHARVRAGGGDRLGDGVEDGDPCTSWPPLPGVTPATTSVP